MNNLLEKNVKYLDEQYRIGQGIISDEAFKQLDKLLIHTDPICDYFNQKHNRLLPKLAKENYNVIIWDNLSRGKYDTYLKNLLRKKNVKFIKKDLTKKINAKKMNVSHIFHLAGSVGVSNVNKNPYNPFLNIF